MTQRGRKSAAALAVVSPEIGAPRALPPAGLTPAQRVVWLETVNSKPSEWFGPEHVPMLEAYCRHVATARALAQQIEEFDPDWLKDDDGLKRYDRLLGMHVRETGRVNEFARAMRLTQQSIYRADKAATLSKRGGVSKPWQTIDVES